MPLARAREQGCGIALDCRSGAPWGGAARPSRTAHERGTAWLLGVFGISPIGGYIHLLLIAVLVLFAVSPTSRRALV